MKTSKLSPELEEIKNKLKAKYNLPDLGSRLAHFIDDKNLSVRKFASQISTNHTKIARVINGSSLTSDTMLAIANKFPEINLNWLITGNGKMNNNELGDEEYADAYIAHKQNESIHMINELKDIYERLISEKQIVIDLLRNEILEQKKNK